MPAWMPRSRFIGSRGDYAAALRVSAHDYRLLLELWVKRLLHRNEEGIQINMENTASHETVYKLAHKAAKANFSSKSDLLRCEGAYRRPKGRKSTLVRIRIPDASFMITPEA